MADGSDSDEEGSYSSEDGYYTEEPDTADDPIARAALNGDLETLREWFANGDRDPNQYFDIDTDVGVEARTLLLTALKRNCEAGDDRTEIVRFLLARGANPMLAMRNQNGPLRDCLPLRWVQYVSEAEALLDAGADVDLVSLSIPGDYSALIQKAGDGNHDIRINSMRLSCLYIRRGADISLIEGRSGYDAYTSAIAQNNWGVAEFIRRVRLAGSYKNYARAPRIDLLLLRELCARGRALPPRRDPVLRRLFYSAPLPNECFWLILAYWHWAAD